ncbi:PREDICTED: protein CURVATURE THYLAKOID 1C, chloroplastic isoform X2 [Lupinus angustifolius]|uniref:protein CURVATURE THYLAKOID 1C, chloroplastic isoform X2 n=1 Tax=Lupinus angustifolius TaxID=3871 RepID=UPI00092E39E2|nr:PREDICTED: protein CURVATURE THYLAKOID 1C, chloroplastic isoform X2 [Lupinus angustifolius]XP_019443455.1 PREDICTED: protein CURVATURE THYLAKOID 1C, chloroplastic isoform X2 [Lupinus angustifolius]
MASIVASLSTPLLLHAAKSHTGNFQHSHLSLLSGRRNHAAFVVKASSESSESTTLTIFKSVQNAWDKPEDRLGLFGFSFAAIVALWASTNLITWFTYRYLLFKPDREELFQILNKSVSDILGQ